MTCTEVISRYFAANLPFTRFGANVAVLSVLSIAPFLGIYIGLIPGFGTSLSTDGAAMGFLLRQLVTNGFFTVFIINFVGFVAFAQIQTDRLLAYAVTDAAARGVAFVALHAVIYLASADLFRSFDGSGNLAMRALGPTLMHAYTFENISGVYLYGLLPGMFLCHGAAAQNVVEHRGSHTGAIAIVTGLLTLIIVVTILAAVINFSVNG